MDNLPTRGGTDAEEDTSAKFRAMAGRKIAIAREAAGFKQSAFARRLHVATSTVGNWETGNALPSFEKMVEIAELTGRPLEFFAYEKLPYGLTRRQSDILALTRLMDEDAQEVYFEIGQPLVKATRERESGLPDH